MKEILQKLKSSWISIKRNANAIMAICAIVGLIISIISIIVLIPRTNSNEKVYVSEEGPPDIKIKSVRLTIIPYQEYNGSLSIALKFYISIRNDGDTTAYGVTINKKTLRLLRSEEPFNLKDTPSLQTIYTSSPFNLKTSETIEDSIFIDESPTDMDKVMKGGGSFSLKYEIYFYNNKADEKLKRNPFIYEYETKFSKGQFEIVAEGGDSAK